MKFTRQEAAYEKAREALRAAIDKEFPVGTRVKFSWGRGWMRGRVVNVCASDCSLVVESDRERFRREIGNSPSRRGIHRVDFRSVEHA